MSTSSPRPVELGKEYTVDIIGTGEFGDGVARVQLRYLCKKCKSWIQKRKN